MSHLSFYRYLIYHIVPGGWSGWTGWGSCSSYCGAGEQSRHRACDDPLPKYAGADCAGNDEETRTCNGGYCTSEWSIYFAFLGGDLSGLYMGSIKLGRTRF